MPMRGSGPTTGRRSCASPEVLASRHPRLIWMPRTTLPTAVMADTEQSCRAKLFDEMKGRIKEDDTSVPDAGRALLPTGVKFVTGAQHPMLTAALNDDGRRRQPGDARRQCRWRRARSISQLAGTSHSHRTIKLLGYGAHDDKRLGIPHAEIPRLIDLETGNPISKMRSSNTSGGSVVWATDCQLMCSTFVLDENHRPSKAVTATRWEHRSRKKTCWCYEENDPGLLHGCRTRPSRGDFILVIDCHDHVDQRGVA